MRTLYRAVVISILVGILAMIRYFGDRLFYDPLKEFYLGEYMQQIVPDFERGKLLLNVSMRFWINTFISLMIIYAAFLDRSILRFSSFLYSFLFLICFAAFTFLIYRIEHEHFLALFYVRRFLIHPLFVIILLPAFYYYRLRNRRSRRNGKPLENPDISAS